MLDSQDYQKILLGATLTACQNSVQFIKISISMCACTARALTCYGALAHSHTHKYAYKIKHTLKRRPNKSLTSGGSGAPNDGFLQNTLKTLRLSRVLLDLQISILSGATKFLSVRSSQGNSSHFEITRGSVSFFRKFQLQF